jgi:hypothetical protein
LIDNEDEFHSFEDSGENESSSNGISVNTSDGYSEDERYYFDKI